MSSYFSSSAEKTAALRYFVSNIAYQNDLTENDFHILDKKDQFKLYEIFNDIDTLAKNNPDEILGILQKTVPEIANPEDATGKEIDVTAIAEGLYFRTFHQAQTSLSITTAWNIVMTLTPPPSSKLLFHNASVAKQRVKGVVEKLIAETKAMEEAEKQQ